MKHCTVLLLFVGLFVIATLANEEPSNEDVSTECGGSRCDRDMDCCRGHRCNSRTMRCERRCQMEGGRCRRNNECCSGMMCSNDRCSRMDCGRWGTWCRNNMDCCQGLMCRNRRCNNRMDV